MGYGDQAGSTTSRHGDERDDGSSGGAQLPLGQNGGRCSRLSRLRGCWCFSGVGAPQVMRNKGDGGTGFFMKVPFQGPILGQSDYGGQNPGALGIITLK